MAYTTMEQDFRSHLALVKDSGDPPRYYLRQGRKLELIAIGNESAARSRFAVRCSRLRRMRVLSGTLQDAAMAPLPRYGKPQTGPYPHEPA